MKIKLKYKKMLYISIYSLLFFLIFLSALYIFNYCLAKKEAANESNLLNTIDINTSIDSSDNINTTNSKSSEANGNETSSNENIQEAIESDSIETERMLQVKTLQEENSDIVGWLEIENTSINYPVLQGTDNEYYMTHNYKKQKSKNGSIFLNKDYDWSIPSNNLLIYGHNLNNGTMFQELLKYSDKNFYINHPTIRFTTEKEDSEFEIISVFKSKVYYKTDTNVFRYYYFINPKTEAEYNNYVESAKNASLYNIDSTATYGDQLITLSTCSYHVKDGRFAVVAKKINAQ